ncbi:hypothetical protein HB662_19835 [Roseomonas frigidaquae]|uniref:ATP-dependent Clp protease proteolytic subunit n=1 Tax=Falsiroseomonas frigidaquae TaxID=487318 RepID=A0ABX1F448_9PROT|nr:ATP-dependent Clp protease proteolytic subunit [Falsiroseomonas frigidaquae]NKE47041.1 hypothetical protein [Falsiroseomonas frigidaquae]
MTDTAAMIAQVRQRSKSAALDHLPALQRWSATTVGILHNGLQTVVQAYSGDRISDTYASPSVRSLLGCLLDAADLQAEIAQRIDAETSALAAASVGLIAAEADCRRSRRSETASWPDEQQNEAALQAYFTALPQLPAQAAMPGTLGGLVEAADEAARSLLRRRLNSRLVARQAPAEPPILVRLHGGIGPAAFSAATIEAILDRHPGRAIVLDIDSLGGSVAEEDGICAAIAAHPARVEAYVSGRCASAATLVLLACYPRSCAAEATFMVHHPATETALVGARMDAAWLRRQAERLDDGQAHALITYATETQTPPAMLRLWQRRGEDFCFSAVEARRWGWVQRIGDRPHAIEEPTA